MTVAVWLVVPLNEIVFGLIVQVDCDGPPEQLSATLCANPPATATEKLAVCPGLTVAVDAPLAVMEKSWPLPISATVCGVFAALSAIVNVPVLVPLVAGSKKTPIAQLEPPATVLPQAFSKPKSLLLVVTLVMLSGVPPLFVIVTLCGKPDVPTNCAGKVIVDGVIETCGAVAPVPVRGTLREPPPGNVIAILRFPARLPIAPGVKVTFKEQLAAGATLPTQLFVCEKSEVFVPLSVTPVIVSAVDWLFVSTAVCGVLAIPMV